MLIHALVIANIAFCSVVLSVTQYFVTNVPGRIVFWPLLIAGLIVYFYQTMKKRSKVLRKPTDKY